MKVLYITNAAAPYKTGLFDCLGGKLKDFRVLYLAGRDYMRLWRDPLAAACHNYKLARSIAIKLPRFESSQFLTLAPVCQLWTYRPDVLILGPYSQVSSLLAMFCALIFNIPVAIWYESHQGSALSRGLFRSLVRRVKFAILSSADSIIVPGIMSLRECLNAGIPHDRVFIAPHSVNNALYADNSSGCSTFVKSNVFRFVYVGQFIPRKNLRRLVDAFEAEFETHEEVRLTLVGGAENQLGFKPSARIEILGFREPAMIPGILAQSDALILPSLIEVWGLVVNEACAAGLPVLVSERCGAAEIVQEGRNGYTFNPEQIEDMRIKMRSLFSHRSNFSPMVIRSDLEAKYNFDNMASGFLAALSNAAKTKTCW